MDRLYEGWVFERFPSYRVADPDRFAPTIIENNLYNSTELLSVSRQQTRQEEEKCDGRIEANQVHLTKDSHGHLHHSVLYENVAILSDPQLGRPSANRATVSGDNSTTHRTSDERGYGCENLNVGKAKDVKINVAGVGCVALNVSRLDNVGKLDADRLNVGRLGNKISNVSKDSEKLNVGKLDNEVLNVCRLDSERVSVGRLCADRLNVGRLDSKVLNVSRLSNESMHVGRLDIKRLNSSKLNEPRPNVIGAKPSYHSRVSTSSDEVTLNHVVLSDIAMTGESQTDLLDAELYDNITPHSNKSSSRCCCGNCCLTVSIITVLLIISAGIAVIIIFSQTWQKTPETPDTTVPAVLYTTPNTANTQGFPTVDSATTSKAITSRAMTTWNRPRTTGPLHIRTITESLSTRYFTAATRYTARSTRWRLRKTTTWKM